MPYSFQKEIIDIFKLEHFKQLKVSTELLVTANDMLVKVLPRGKYSYRETQKGDYGAKAFFKGLIILKPSRRVGYI